MSKKIDHNQMGGSDHGWLKSKFHFSFADYYNPNNIQFGQLRVVNDDLVLPGTGFETHPHRDMEIISYVVDGALTHGDSMGNKNTLTRGQVQYMSAGTGVYHSEHNRGTDMLRFLQIWILPEKKGLTPNYGDCPLDWDGRRNQWLHMVSGQNGTAPIKIHQDSNIYALELDAGGSIDFAVGAGRQAYLVQIEGTSDISGIEMIDRDAMEIVADSIKIQAHTKSHCLLIEMKAAG